MRKVMILSAGAVVVVIALALSVWQVQPLSADPPNLVARYHLNDDASDSSSNGLDGSINGAGFIGGRYGNALDFDGSDDCVTVPDASALDISTGSWEAWVRFDTIPSVAGHHMNPLAKAEQYWIHASDGTGAADGDIPRKDALQAKVNVGGQRYTATTEAEFIQADVWYHVVGTYDGDTLKLYIDGQLVDENAYPTGNIQNTSNVLAIGTWSSLVDFHDGQVDEVRIWNCVLTAEGIQKHAMSNSSSSAKCYEPS